MMPASARPALIKARAASNKRMSRVTQSGEKRCFKRCQCDRCSFSKVGATPLLSSLSNVSGDVAVGDVAGTGVSGCSGCMNDYPSEKKKSDSNALECNCCHFLLYNERSCKCRGPL